MNNYPILTRNLHGKCIAADANEVKGHTLDCHPPVGWPHGEDTLHLHSPILLPLDLHRWSLEGNRHLHPCGVFIAPASLKEICGQTKAHTLTWTQLHFYTLARCKIVCAVTAPYAVILTWVVFQNTGTKWFWGQDSQMKCKSEWLCFPISPQQQASLPLRVKIGKRKTNINYLVSKKKCSFYSRKPNYTAPLWMCLLLWFVLNIPLTIHLDLECDGCICQVTSGVEGVLALFLGIHSLQLQSSVVSDGGKHKT